MNSPAEKTVITIETFQRTTIRTRREIKIAWCEDCAAETVMLSPDQAAVQLQITAREIFRMAESGEIHYSETEIGALLACRNSYQDRLR